MEAYHVVGFVSRSGKPIRACGRAGVVAYCGLQRAMANLFVTRRLPSGRSIAIVSCPHVLGRCAFFLALVFASFLALACSTSKAPNSNSTAVTNLKSNSNAGPNAEQRSAQPITLDIKEPERYSAAMTISIQGTSDVPASMATQQFGFSKLGADRRWAFTFPAPLGRVGYL